MIPLSEHERFAEAIGHLPDASADIAPFDNVEQTTIPQLTLVVLCRGVGFRVRERFVSRMVDPHTAISGIVVYTKDEPIDLVLGRHLRRRTAEVDNDLRCDARGV